MELLDTSPTDVEAWSELSDLYFSQGLYAQAIYSLEEVLLVAPNAWNVGLPFPERNLVGHRHYSRKLTLFQI